MAEGRRLFDVGKVPLFVDAVSAVKAPRSDGTEFTAVKLKLKLGPFDAKLATAIDTGLGGDSNVRRTVFNLNDDEPKLHVEGMVLGLDCPRQRLDLYATPDTKESRRCFDQAKIGKLHIRIPKDTANLEVVFTATFGPVGRDELEAAFAAFHTQIFVTFLEAEASLDFEEEETTRKKKPGPPVDPPMWDEGEGPADGVIPSIADAPTRARGKKKADQPDAAAQKPH